MRVPIAALATALVLGAACEAAAVQGTASGHCEGDKHVITVGGWYFPDADGEITGLVLVRTAIGVCRDPKVIPDDPLPFEPVPGGEPGLYEYTATVTVPVPAEAAVYAYTPYAVRPDGSREILHAQCSADDRSFALISCGDLPFVRGTVEYDFSNISWCGLCFRVAPCQDDCWTIDPWLTFDSDTLEGMTGRTWQDLLGSAVDLHGDRTWCVMPGGAYYEVTRIVPTEGGVCGSVPAAASSWGSLKAMYR